MKKLAFYLYLQLLTLPAWLVLAGPINKTFPVLNLIGFLWAFILVVYGKKMMPEWMFRYLKWLVRED